MATFTDQTGVSWSVILDLGKAEELRSANLDPFHPEQLESLLGHPLDQARALSILTRDQAKSQWGRDYSPERYGQHLFGHFPQAKSALIDEIKRFFRTLGRSHAADAVDEFVALSTAIQPLGVERLRKVAEALRSAIASGPTGNPPAGGPQSRNSPPSPAASTGGPSRTANSPGQRGPHSGQPGGGRPSSPQSSPTPVSQGANGPRTTSTPSRRDGVTGD